MIVNHAYTASIRRTPIMHKPADAKRIHWLPLTCSACHMYKIARAPTSPITELVTDNCINQHYSTFIYMRSGSMHRQNRQPVALRGRSAVSWSSLAIMQGLHVYTVHVHEPYSSTFTSCNVLFRPSKSESRPTLQKPCTYRRYKG